MIIDDVPTHFTNNHAVSMTLRDYFAAKAMQNFLSTVGWNSDQKWFDEIAVGSYRMADAMLKARTK
jgi:hypothetical protein